MTLPERLESGTVGVPGIIALHEGIKHICLYGMENIQEKCRFLENRVTTELSGIQGVTVYGKTKNKVSTVLFNIDKLHSEEVSLYLSDKGICVRGGLHCAPLCHKALGTSEKGGVRVSMSHFNTVEDVDFFIEQVKKTAT